MQGDEFKVGDICVVILNKGYSSAIIGMRIEITSLENLCHSDGEPMGETRAYEPLPISDEELAKQKSRYRFYGVDLDTGKSVIGHSCQLELEGFIYIVHKILKEHGEKGSNA